MVAVVMTSSSVRVAEGVPLVAEGAQSVRVSRDTPSPATGGSRYVMLVKDPTASAALPHCPVAVSYTHLTLPTTPYV